MKSALRLVDYPGHMQQAAQQAVGFVERMDKNSFIADRLTQQAVLFNLVVMGEAAGNVLTSHADFAQKHPDIPWRSIRATRNRIAHGYFDIDLDIVWDTVQSALPPLVAMLPTTIAAAEHDLRTGVNPPPGDAP
ncbi:DUF86 domain-containing protein [Pseudorhodoferax aquiterrae]|uniref:DUF86 domain-containing protein n=1 Tax=Pseudorhodoferax aquiterrae TaxID=747304 RepID=A0ABQ3G581_9BURK|nr:DUF86 domain-containing protein [Pseudorhodoferax aquiterrae]GHC89799.1 DUF86 domain-containing protein [Pseudorhodoferax aquiterrae]